MKTMRDVKIAAARIVGAVCLTLGVFAPELASADDERAVMSMGFAMGARDYGGTSLLVDEGERVVQLGDGMWTQSGLRYDATFESPIDVLGGALWTRATFGLDLLFGTSQGLGCGSLGECAQPDGVAGVNSMVVRGGMGVALGEEVSVFGDMLGSLNMLDARVFGDQPGKGVATRFDFSARLGMRLPLNDYSGLQLAGEIGVFGAPGFTGEVAFIFGW